MKFTAKLHRGESGRSSDAGDFGAGQYWSSNRAQARAYAGNGIVRHEKIVLCRPILLTVSEAYDLAEEFGTITGDPDRPGTGAGDMDMRRVCAQAMRKFMLMLGYDGMVVEHDRPWGPELEVVIYNHERGE